LKKELRIIWLGKIEGEYCPSMQKKDRKAIGKATRSKLYIIFSL
jgi:hypothetical protein